MGIKFLKIMALNYAFMLDFAVFIPMTSSDLRKLIKEALTAPNERVIPVSKTSVAKNNDVIKNIGGMDGWEATRFQEGRGLGSWRIDNEKGRLAGTVWDNGTINVVDRTTLENSAYEYGRFDLANNPAQAARYIYLKSQKPIDVISELSKNKQDFTQYNLRDELPVPGLNNWVIRRELVSNNMQDKLYWQIYTTDGKGGYASHGRIFDNGDFYYGLESGYFKSFEKGRDEFATNPFQAARYVWLKSQKPITEYGKYITPKGIPTAKNGDTVEAKGIDGWWAIRRIMPSSVTSHWRILTDDPYYKGVDIGAIYDNGELVLRNPSGKVREIEKDRQDLANNPEQTIRYVFLKTQEPITENILAEKIYRPLRKIPVGTEGMPEGWYAEKDKDEEIWYFYDASGIAMGYVNKGGLVWMFNSAEDESNETEENRPDFYANPVKAAQYMWLKRQRPLNESKKSNTIELPNLGYSVRKITSGHMADGTIYYWSIYDSDDREVGRFHPHNKVLFYKNEPRTIRLHAWDEYTEFNGGPEKAAQYVWLKRQKPISEEAKSKPKPVIFKDMPGWKAIRYNRGKFPRYGIIAPRHLWLGSYGINSKTLEINIGGQRNEAHWEPVKDQTFEDVHQAMRYVFLKTQKPLTENKIENPDDVIAAKFADDVEIPGMEGWWAYRIGDGHGVKENYWLILNKKESIGRIYDDGLMVFTEENPTERVPHLADDPIQAARYMYLKKQKPISEDVVDNKRWDLENEEYRKTFDDIGGWYTRPAGGDRLRMIKIFSNEKKLMGYLVDRFGKHTLHYGNAGMESLYGNPVFSEHTPWNFNNVKNAVRYVFLNSQKPLSENSGAQANVYGSPAELNFSILDNMFMLKTLNAGAIFWTFYNNARDFNRIGTLIYNPGLKLAITPFEWTIRFGTTPIYEEEDASRFVDGLNIDFDQVAKYIWLKNQKPLSENSYHISIAKDCDCKTKCNQNTCIGRSAIRPVTSIQINESVDYFDSFRNKAEYSFPEFGYRAQFQMRTMAHTYFEIYAGKNKDHVARLHNDGTLNYYDYGTNEWVRDDNFGTDLKNAVRFVWLKNQKPIKAKDKLREAIIEVLEEEHFNRKGNLTLIEKGEKTAYPDIAGWFTITFQPNTIAIYAPTNKKSNDPTREFAYRMGTLSEYTGNLMYDDSKGKFRKTPWDFKNVKNAVRYVYLHTQKPNNNKMSKNEIQESIASEDIPEFKSKLKSTGINNVFFIRTVKQPYATTNTYDFYINPEGSEEWTDVARLVFGKSWGTPSLYLSKRSNENATRFMREDDTPDIKKLASYLWLRYLNAPKSS